MLRCIEDGKPLTSKSTPIMRSTLRSLCQVCLRMPSFEAQRWAFVNAFHAVGRTGELADATWNNSYWDSDDHVPYILWNERKVAKQSWLNFFCDFQHYEICWFHSLACYLVMGGGSQAYISSKFKESFFENALCPEIASLTSNSVASKNMLGCSAGTSSEVY